ncbi:MAG: hypothetical protein QUS14_07040 [Pyrinomonadaceae bacterium]|nr:hypothetical protein [Pyrinomonadaceae bacterium]
MKSVDSDRREFIRLAAAAAVFPLLAGCRDPAYAQSGDVLKSLRKNAISDAGCEWCGGRDVPDSVGPRAVLAEKSAAGERLLISGTVFGKDGKPAPNTLIYLYHTDANGLYGRGREHKHGKHRGWMLTDAKGHYEFETIRPASYPSSTIAAHIHMTVTTADQKEDWIDSILFEGDRFITKRERESRKGGFNPILTLERNAAGVYTGTRDIQLV